ncbi:DNA polymerase III subunit gamma/tau [Candidatus Daviesbacteria bacterium]|nr:DNA polymerase III subunit gamma/tau [Candidatus Daviesbacteria bacterium]
MVLYRKYRPQTLEELVGQPAVKKTLTDAFKAGKLAHAYLLVGPRGTGKTSTARILAKMVNCQDKNPPCNKCSMCLSITDGSNLDLIEIDAASNRGIDDVRALRENIKLVPSSAQKKVYIIDEVHMLTTEAFNALLKTLEEPPSHALFILATTESSKIPQTILSRVQRLDFKLASMTDLVQALEVVAKPEKIKTTEGALRLLAKTAEGSFRDAVKLLDQLASTGQEITERLVNEGIKVSDFQVTVELLQALAKKDSSLALSQVNQQMEKGINAKELTSSLMGFLRQLLFIKNGLGLQLVKEEVGSDKYDILLELADKLSTSEVISGLDKLQEAGEKLKVASIPSLPLEIAVVEICGNDNTFSKESDKNQKMDNSVEDPQAEKGDMSELSKIKEKWTFVLETIRPFNFSLEALLRSVKIADCSNGVVLLEVPYSFHQRILEAAKSKDLLESVLSDVLSKPVKVSTVLGTRPQRIEDIANVEVAADDEIISMASEIFNGKLVD